MDIIKKNLLSIIAGVVALLALIAWIWPLGSIQAEEEARLKARADVGTKMQSLLSENRTLPVVSVKGGQSEPLGSFPTQKVIDWGTQLTAKLAEQAKGVKEVALRINKRELLVPGSLPVPAPTTEFAFRDVYQQYMADYQKMVKAGSPPTQADIQAAAQDLWKSKYQPQVTSDPVTQQQVQAEFQKESAELPDIVKHQRAKSILFYMAPQALDVNPAFATSTGTAPTATMIWDAQLKIWVQNDVVQAIVDLNSRMSQEKCVIDAPVKQLVKIQIEGFRGAPSAAAGGGVGMGMMEGMPPGMPPDDFPGMGMPMGGAAAGGTGKPSDSPTGRAANALYDVVPFRLDVHVEADKLPDFLEELGRNRFITPYQVSSIKAVDSVVLGYSTNVMYGSAPVVDAVIHGEAILLRDWTVPLMPAEVKASLQITDTGAGGASPAPAKPTGSQL